MRWRRVLSCAAVLTLILALLPIASAAPAQQDALNKIEPQVLSELNANGRTDFIVWMAEKADLSPAGRLQTKEEKGRFVYDTLRETAARTQASLRRYLDQHGIQYKPFYIANILLVQGGTQAQLSDIAARPDVARVTANHQLQLQEPTKLQAPATQPAGVEPNISFVNADDAWALGVTGAGTVLAGNDTGLDETHPAIAPHYRGCLNPPACTSWDHDYNWWDATQTFPTDPDDDNGHGTHTTGIMVGDDGAGNQIGMAPGAQTIHCKNMDFWGLGTDATFTECFQWDLAPWDLNGQNPRPDLAPDAINNSWGYRAGNNPVFEDEVDALQAAGIAVEASAGNEGGVLGCDTVGSPGDYAQLITTGSVARYGGMPGIISDFTSRGPSNLDPDSFVPDVMAPGEDVRSAIPGGEYDHWSGTSMSGPHVVGLIGLLWSAQPALRGQPALTYRLIQETAVPLTGQMGFNCGGDYDRGPNNDWGWGTVDALAAVQRVLALGSAGALQGTVSDATSGLPVPGVLVTTTDQAGLSWIDYSDAAGTYTLTLAAGTYTLTATAFAYFSTTLPGIVVITDNVTTQDLLLQPLPTYVVSGTVTAEETGQPIEAEIRFPHTPVDSVYSNPLTGFYSVTLPQGPFTLHAIAAGRDTEYRPVVVDHDQTQNFSLPLHPCVLLVDDDQDDPDVDDYYTAALDTLGLDYNVWRVQTQGDPESVDLAGYPTVFWYNGYPTVNTLNPTNEYAVMDYLDSGGNWIFSSQSYLTEAHLSDFAFYYLHVYSLLNDVYHEIVTGTGPFAGLGPYTLDYPFPNESDGPNPAPEAQYAFTGLYDYGAGIAYSGSYRMIFLAFPFEALSLADRTEVLSSTLAYFGVCQPGPGDLAGRVTDADSGVPLVGANITARPGSGQAVTGPDGAYSMTLTIGTYDITAQAAGYYSETVAGVVIQESATTVQDFTLTRIPPAIAITPGLISLTLPAGMSQDVPLTLANEGGTALAWSVAESPATDWLSEAPVSGTVAPLGSAPVTVTLDAGSLAPGLYTTTLEFASNDPSNPLVVIPVAMNVSCEPVHDLGFTWTPSLPLNGQVITLTASAGGTAPISFTWGLGDGNVAFGAVVTHTYAAAGEYGVLLAAENCAGQGVATVEQTVTVACDGIVSATFSWLPLTPTVGTAVEFTATVSGGTPPFSYTWSFGDGSSSAGLTVTHAYTLAGAYTVTLTAADACGTTAAVGMITVAPVEQYVIFLPVVVKQAGTR